MLDSELDESLTDRGITSGGKAMRLTHQTLRDPSLPHQAIFLALDGGHYVVLSCNCLVYKKNGQEAHYPMGPAPDLNAARELYNNPENHIRLFDEADRAKW